MKTLILILLLLFLFSGCAPGGFWMIGHTIQAQKYPECSTCQSIEEQRQCIEEIVAKEGKRR